MKKICRDDLAAILTKQFQFEESDPISAYVVISDDGKHAVFHIQDRSWARKLSPLGKEYLKDCESMTFVNQGPKKNAEAFLEPK